LKRASFPKRFSHPPVPKGPPVPGNRHRKASGRDDKGIGQTVYSPSPFDRRVTWFNLLTKYQNPQIEDGVARVTDFDAKVIEKNFKDLLTI